MKEVPKITLEINGEVHSIVTFNESPMLETIKVKPFEGSDLRLHLNRSNIPELIEALEKIRDEE